MATFLKLLASAVIGVGLGLASVYVSVSPDAGFAAISSGAWTTAPRRGAMDADPYARASVSRYADLPITIAEGLSFLARRDDDGASFDARCDYRLVGKPMAARAWTLTLLAADGRPVQTEDARRNYTSHEVLHAEDGAFEIAVAAQARPGNWLAAPQSGSFELMLRLYETSIGANPGAIAAAGLPKIAKGACR